MHDMGATGWGLLDMHRARRPPFLFRGGVNLPPPRPIGKDLIYSQLYIFVGQNFLALVLRRFISANAYTRYLKQ